MGLQDLINAANDDEKSAWQQRKTVARCKCTDQSKFECCNFDIPCSKVNDEEVCTCRCHKVRP